MELGETFRPPIEARLLEKSGIVGATMSGLEFAGRQSFPRHGLDYTSRRSGITGPVQHPPLNDVLVVQALRVRVAERLAVAGRVAPNPTTMHRSG